LDVRPELRSNLLAGRTNYVRLRGGGIVVSDLDDPSSHDERPGAHRTSRFAEFAEPLRKIPALAGILWVADGNQDADYPYWLQAVKIRNFDCLRERQCIACPTNSPSESLHPMTKTTFGELPNRARFTFRGRSFVKTAKSMSEDGIAMEIFFRPKLKWRSRNLTVFLRPVLSKPIDNGKVAKAAFPD